MEGDYLNEHINSERTNFSFPADRTAGDDILDEITLDSIRDGALDCVSRDLQPYLEEINIENVRR